MDLKNNTDKEEGKYDFISIFFSAIGGIISASILFMFSLSFLEMMIVVVIVMLLLYII